MAWREELLEAARLDCCAEFLFEALGFTDRCIGLHPGRCAFQRGALGGLASLRGEPGDASGCAHGVEQDFEGLAGLTHVLWRNPVVHVTGEPVLGVRRGLAHGMA